MNAAVLWLKRALLMLTFSPFIFLNSFIQRVSKTIVILFAPIFNRKFDSKFFKAYMLPNCFSICAKFYQDLNKLRQENFLTCIDKILSRSHQGFSSKLCYHDLGKILRVKQEFSRPCMTFQVASSFVSLVYCGNIAHQIQRWNNYTR